MPFRNHLQAGILLGLSTLLAAVTSFATPTPPVPPEVRARPNATPPILEVNEDDFWSDQFGLPIPNGTVNCAVVHEGALLIGGSFTMIGGNHIPYLAAWNGFEWVSVGSRVDGPVSAFFIDAPSSSWVDRFAT